MGFVEDDPIIRDNYSDFLRGRGYQVAAFSERTAALEAFRAALPEIVLLDVDLGSEQDGGLRLCEELRALSPQLPIVFLTCHDDEADRASGFRLGADEYLSKDASLDFLAVRIETLLARHATLLTPADDAPLRMGELTLDRTRSVAHWRGEAVRLTLTQYWIVEALAASPERALSYQELMEAARVRVEPNTITAHIVAIRRRFRELDPDFAAVRSERGLGYRWVVASS